MRLPCGNEEKNMVFYRFTEYSFFDVVKYSLDLSRLWIQSFPRSSSYVWLHSPHDIMREGNILGEVKQAYRTAYWPHGQKISLQN